MTPRQKADNSEKAVDADLREAKAQEDQANVQTGLAAYYMNMAIFADMQEFEDLERDMRKGATDAHAAAEAAATAAKAAERAAVTAARGAADAVDEATRARDNAQTAATNALRDETAKDKAYQKAYTGYLKKPPAATAKEVQDAAAAKKTATDARRAADTALADAKTELNHTKAVKNRVDKAVADAQAAATAAATAAANAKIFEEQAKIDRRHHR
jgi:hypothetical protein